MNKAIITALTYLNEIEVRGERNCTLLAAAIKELKPLQAPRIPLPGEIASADERAQYPRHDEEGQPFPGA